MPHPMPPFARSFSPDRFAPGKSWCRISVRWRVPFRSAHSSSRAGTMARSHSTSHWNRPASSHSPQRERKGRQMANKHHGEIEACINGKTWKLCLTLGALSELESAFGDDDMLALAQRFEKGRLSAN